MPIDNTEREEVLILIRKLFHRQGPRDRETALHDLAEALGYQRVGPAIREVLSSDLLTAVKRGILENDRGELRLFANNLRNYHRDDLKDSFLAAIGRGWITRKEAIKRLARWLGFARTGSEMMKEGRSLINGLIRTGDIEAEGREMIRRV